MYDLEYIKKRQKEWERRWNRAFEVEAKKEEERVAKMEAEAREIEEIAARKKLLLEQQEDERFHQKHIQRKRKEAEQKWDKQFDTLLAQIKDRLQEDNKLEEIRIIIQNREPSLQELDWESWLSDPLNQRLAALDFEYAMEMFKRDSLMAKRRKRTGGKKKYRDNYALVFTGDTAADAAEDYVTTNFNPDDYNLNLGFTVSYWVRADAVGASMFAFGRKHSNHERFTFGINHKQQVFIGTGGNRLRSSWSGMGMDTSQLEYDGSNWILKTDGTWYHFAVTYADRADTSTSVERKLYINGAHMDTGPSNINWSTTGGDTGGMIFGGRTVGGVEYQDGWACGLDEVAIYDTAKDSDWVTDVYDGGAKYDHEGASNLVGYWKFNKGSGTTVKDHSGNGNHGTFAAISGDTTAQPTWEKVKLSDFK